MAGDSVSIMDKLKAKLAKVRVGRHKGSVPGSAGVRFPALAARHTGTSADEKPSMMQRLKAKLPGSAS